MRPAVARVLDSAEAARAPAAAPGGEDLAALLDKLLQACQGACGPLLDATLAPQSGLTGFGLLGNSILAEIDSALADRLPGGALAPQGMTDGPSMCIMGHLRVPHKDKHCI